MNSTVKTALRNTHFLKAVSLILGYVFWLIISDSFFTTRWVTVPVCFYNTQQEKIEAPETIKIQLQGKRAALRALDTASLALHIDALTLKNGPQVLIPTTELLFLPQTIFVGETIPHNVKIIIHKSGIAATTQKTETSS